MFKFLLLTLIAGYGLIVLIMALNQGKLLYFPEKQTVSGVRYACGELGLVQWPGPGDRFRGYAAEAKPAAEAPPRATVLVFHGNAGSAMGRLHYIAALGRLGFRVILAEYPGYGCRPGRPSESLLVRDAEASVEAALLEFGGPLVLWGESLGCGVTAAAAGRVRDRIRGVVLLTPWESLPRLARSQYPWLPARWLLRDRYDNASNLSAFTGPKAVLLAGSDEVIPVEHGRSLFASLPGSKRLWTFKAAGHNSWPDSPDLAWWSEVMDFVMAEDRDRADGSQAGVEPGAGR